MKKFGSPAAIAALLSFNGGFVDTAGFLGLAGLFSSHVTGNFVTLGAALVYGHHGIIGKVLALPEFILVVALARLAGNAMRPRGLPVLRIMLAAEVALLTVFFLLAVSYGPFPNADSPAALLTGLSAISAMALQNAFQRVHFGSLPPTTIMTGNTTQFTIDAVDLAVGAGGQRDVLRRRLRQLVTGMITFAAGCAASAFLFWLYGFWCVGLAVLVGALAAVMRTVE